MRALVPFEAVLPFLMHYVLPLHQLKFKLQIAKFKLQIYKLLCRLVTRAGKVNAIFLRDRH